jgi:hypothetical protein
MSRVLKLLAVLLVVALIAAFLPVWKGGRPLLSLEDLRQPDALPRLDLDGRPDTVLIYKWRDAEGEIHYSNEPPPPDALYEQIEIDPDVNTLPAVPASDSER